MLPDRLRDRIVCLGPTIDALLKRRGDEIRHLLRAAGVSAAYWERSRRLPLRILEQLHGSPPPLGPGDRIAVKGSRSSLPAVLRIDAELAWLIGLYVAEGYRREKQIVLSNTDQQLLDRVEAVLHALGQPTYRQPGAITCCSVLLAGVFESIEVGSTASTKRLPTGALGWPRDLLASLLSGLLDGDGSVSSGRESLWTTSRHLVGDVLYLAARLGRRAATQGRRPRPRCRPAHVVSLATNEHKVLTSVPLPSLLLTGIRSSAGLSQGCASRLIGYRYPTSLNNLEKRRDRGAVRVSTLKRVHRAYAPVASVCTDQLTVINRLGRLVEGDLLWDAVVEVVDTGRFEPVYDLEVRPGGARIENFLAGHGGVFVSNTAGFVDPGFDGHLTLELSNVANLPISLYLGMKIGQISFFRMTTPAEHPYGSTEAGSKYQGQVDPTPSRFHREFERRG